MKQGRSYFTVIVWILLAAITAYFVYNVASSLYAPLMTATVTQYEAGAGYYASGFVVRAEEVVTSEYDTTVLACAEGAHVAANDVVATGYRSDDAKTRKTRMDELTGQIEQLQYAWSAASSVYDQAALDSSIADSLSHLSQYLARRDMNSVSDLTPELKGLVLRRTSDAADSASLQLLILSSDQALQNVTLLRQQSAEIVFASYSGLRVPKSAVRVENGQTGVYILEGTLAKWKPITILHDTGESYVAALDTSSTDNLWPGDELIINAKNLYDGKVVN